MASKRKVDEIQETIPATCTRRKCPYLDTISKKVLDFDFEKVCSVTLQNQNVYCCLVCGNYFHGKGKTTPAYLHSVNADHHVFIHLTHDRIYCLPDNYEVHDNSLQSIKDALRPTFSKVAIQKLDSNRTLAQDVFGVSYLPGFIGMNNLSRTDYVNVVIQGLTHVAPLRDYFLMESNYMNTVPPPSELVCRFGALTRHLWSPNNIKNTISPHEMLQEISALSRKRFQIGTQNSSIAFLSWFLNELHTGLGGSRKRDSSIIYKVFQGDVDIITTTESEMTHVGDTNGKNTAVASSTSTSPFLFLTLDLPPTPLFKDAEGSNVIPQISLYTVLEKFNGVTETFTLRGSARQRTRYLIKNCPRYLILTVARFTKNNFFIEKNPTIVNFPIKQLDLSEFVDTATTFPSQSEIDIMSISSLKTLLKNNSISFKGCLEKSELIAKVQTELFEKARPVYDLLTNIVHDSSVNKGEEATTKNNPLTGGSYRVHVQNQASETWYEIQDLIVQETMPQLISQSESFVLIYKRRNHN